MKEKVLKMLEISKSTEVFQKLRDNAIINLQKTLTDEKEFEKAMTFIVKEFTYETFLADVIQIYCEEYTEDEIDFILSYYTSDMYKKIQDKIPHISARMIESGQKIGQELTEKYFKNFDKI